jgi:hypothetical protein
MTFMPRDRFGRRQDAWIAQGAASASGGAAGLGGIPGEESRAESVERRSTLLARRFTMRRGWIALALVLIAGGLVAHADGVGCCDVECHSTDDSGASLHTMQRKPMTQVDCEAITDCDATWHPEACAVGGEAGISRHSEPE